MSYTVDDVYQFMLRLIRKNQSAGVSASEFNDFWNDAQYAYLSDLVGRFNAKNNSKEGINTGLIQNEVILTKLAPFTNTVTLTVAGGKTNKPPDFQSRLALRVNGAACTRVNKNSIARMLKDVIDPPSVADDTYYYTEYLKYYSFFPNTITAADLDYITLPIKVEWGFKFDGDGREIYDSSASTDPAWDDLTTLEITRRMLTDIGISFKDADFLQFGSRAVATGDQ